MTFCYCIITAAPVLFLLLSVLLLDLRHRCPGLLGLACYPSLLGELALKTLVVLAMLLAQMVLVGLLDLESHAAELAKMAQHAAVFSMSIQVSDTSELSPTWTACQRNKRCLKQIKRKNYLNVAIRIN